MYYQISENKSGRPVLTVYYDAALKNWNDIIDRALKEAKLDGEKTTVIAIPKRLKHALL